MSCATELCVSVDKLEEEKKNREDSGREETVWVYSPFHVMYILSTVKCMRSWALCLSQSLTVRVLTVHRVLGERVVVREIGFTSTNIVLCVGHLNPTQSASDGTDEEREENLCTCHCRGDSLVTSKPFLLR